MLVAFDVDLAAFPTGRTWAAFGEDLEKPKPEFNQEGQDWIARLIPRGKSTSIQIRFHVQGGALKSVTEQEFAAGQQPHVDLKDFRSGFFAVLVDVGAPGAEARLSLSTPYFTSATQLWRGKPEDPRSWIEAQATNLSLAERVNELTITLRDGGPLDTDGQADSRIIAVVAPHDSFWGYALGTLFIRFFGVFIVLGVLLLGMLVSGKIFQTFEARAQRSSGESLQTAALAAAELAPTPTVTPEAVAAIALAIHLNSAPVHAQAPTHAHPKPTSVWALFGRGKLMGDRMPVFDRIQKK